MPKPNSNNSHEWTLEIVPAHADRIHVVSGLVNEIFIAMIPGTNTEEMLNALAKVRAEGFEPVPHLAARSFSDERQLEHFCDGLRDHAINKILLIAGGLSKCDGLYSNSLQILQSPAFEKAGVSTVALAGHPEGNPADPAAAQSLREKILFLRQQGKAAEIVTQWSFSPGKVNHYLEQLHTDGLDIPTRIGVPGPASLKTLLKYAKICGVKASATVLKKQGLSLGRLLLASDPASFVQQVRGTECFHLYPFGGLEKSAAWLEQQAACIAKAALACD
jgi:methylenetetrahydrofolate reductase (NADPH)